MFFKCLNKAIEVLTVLILAVITAMVSVEVVLRYGFGGSLFVTEEFTRYALVWMVFLACSLAVATIPTSGSSSSSTSSRGK